jgi:serine kinase of HPr protein (carbohydrate metabolism regulator)
MSERPLPTVHASAVAVGESAVLIRGPSGAGKSRLAFDLMLAGRAGQLTPVTLVGDDRVVLTREQAGVIVRPARGLEGLLEIRGLGIRRCDFASQAVVGLVVDLEAPDAARMPAEAALETELMGVKVPRIPVDKGVAALALVIGALTTTKGYATF